MKSLLLLLAMSIALPTLAQGPVRRTQVYRCGPDGRDLRDSPCPNGSPASSADADPAGTADTGRSRVAEAKQAAARRAGELEAQRQRSQAYGLKEQPASAAQVASAKPARPAASGAGR